MKVSATKDHVKIMGRCIQRTDVCYLGHAGSYIEFKVTASYVDVALDTVLDVDAPELQIYLAVFNNEDPKPKKRFSPKPGLDTYRIYQSDRPATVTLRLFKLTESAYGNVGVCAIETDGTEVVPTAYKDRRIEFVGDSITCGYGVEQAEFDVFTTLGENAFRAYAVQTARLLDADDQIVAKSGIGIYSGYIDPDVNEPCRKDQMSAVYQYTDLYTSRSRGFDLERWTTDRFDAQLVVINLGTNDDSYVRTKAERAEKFSAALESFIGDVVQKNPSAQILYVFGMMRCGLGETVARKIHVLQKTYPQLHFLEMSTPKDGFALVGHPSAQMHWEAAKKTAETIRTLMRW